MDQAEALAKVRVFASWVGPEFHPDQVPLFGSYARGDQRSESDVDVAVVVKPWSKSILEAQSELFRLSHTVDLRIEPVLIEEDHDRSGFLASFEETVARFRKPC